MTEQPQPTSANGPAPYAPTPMLEADARLWAMLINVAAVAGAVLTGGTLSFVGILVIWLVYRERSALVDFHGKQQLNLAITVFLAGVAAVVGSIITLGLGAFVLVPLLIVYGIVVVVFSILAAVAANKGEYYRIPLVIHFVK